MHIRVCMSLSLCVCVCVSVCNNVALCGKRNDLTSSMFVCPCLVVWSYTSRESGNLDGLDMDGTVLPAFTPSFVKEAHENIPRGR